MTKPRRQPHDDLLVDTSTQSFHMAMGPDGISRTIGMTETFSDGSTRHVAYEDVPTDDPYVKMRQRIAGEDPPSEVSTTFAPSQIRPPTYPAGMPFLEGRESHTRESPRGSHSEHVRWRCIDPDVVQGALADILVAEGWVEAPLSAAPPLLQTFGGQVFQRDRRMRLISRYDFDGGSVIDLMDTVARSSGIR